MRKSEELLQAEDAIGRIIRWFMLWKKTAVAMHVCVAAADFVYKGEKNYADINGGNRSQQGRPGRKEPFLIYQEDDGGRLHLDEAP
jgi:hypothetical protein